MRRNEPPGEIRVALKFMTASQIRAIDTKLAKKFNYQVKLGNNLGWENDRKSPIARKVLMVLVSLAVVFGVYEIFYEKLKHDVENKKLY